MVVVVVVVGTVCVVEVVVGFVCVVGMVWVVGLSVVTVPADEDMGTEVVPTPQFLPE